MAAVISDLLVTLFVAAFGVVLGWFVRALLYGGNPGRELAGATDPEIARAKEVLARLREVAASVAADVGQHSQRVERINEELNASNTADPEAVVGAVAKLLQTNRQMQHQLASAEVRLQDQARQIESQTTAALTDALTGLANRRALDDSLARRLADFQRLRQTFWMMMLDVDHFKRFNDMHGHQAGDEVLRGVARVLLATAPKPDLVARYGGEELVVLFTGPANAATQKATAIREAIDEARFRFEGVELHVTVSVGLAEIASGEDAAGLIRRADAALYTSKKSGRNCAHWHDGREIRRIGGDVRQTPPAGAQQAQAPLPAAKRAKPPCHTQTNTASHTAPPKPAAPPHCARPAALPEPETTAEAEEPQFQPQPGLANRTAFCTMVSSQLAEWRRGGATPTILLLQVDRFAEITSRGDHQLGNQVLRSVTACLTATLREMNMVAHYDEAVFAAILPDAESLAALRLAERLRAEVSRCVVQTEAGPLPLTASVGGAEALVTDDGTNLLRRAAEALDAAVRSGGNACYFHNGQWSETAAAALEKAGVAPTT